MPEYDLQQLVGKRISAVDPNDDHPILRFDDGTAVTFVGLGYDGLWDEVLVSEISDDEH